MIFRKTGIKLYGMLVPLRMKTWAIQIIHDSKNHIIIIEEIKPPKRQKVCFRKVGGGVTIFKYYND